MDTSIVSIINEYRMAIHHIISIGGLVFLFVVICGFIRLGIASMRKAKGIYPAEGEHTVEH